MRFRGTAEISERYHLECPINDNLPLLPLGVIVHTWEIMAHVIDSCYCDWASMEN